MKKKFTKHAFAPLGPMMVRFIVTDNRSKSMIIEGRTTNKTLGTACMAFLKVCGIWNESCLKRRIKK